MCCDCENCECGCAEEPNAVNYDVREVAEKIFERVKDKPDAIEGIREEGVFAIEMWFYRIYGEYPGDMDFCSDVFGEVRDMVSEDERLKNLWP